MIDLETIRERWSTEQRVYGELADHVKGILESQSKARGIPCTLGSRPKGVASLLKKALRGNYADPYNEITDKAGVRAICTYFDDLSLLEKIVIDQFSVQSYENKTVGLEYNQLGYLGIHFEVKLPEDTLISVKKKELSGLVCEIQLHTRAQNLWADISHELSYKAAQDPPVEVKRAIYRLVALVEIFDQEVRQARETMLSLPGFQEAQMLEQLERNIYKFTTNRFDRELSLFIIPKLEGVFSETEIQGYGALIDSFVERNEPKLQAIYRDYADDGRHALLFQPESLLIFERIERNSFVIKEVWARILPLDLLDSLATVWGTAI